MTLYPNLDAGDVLPEERQDLAAQLRVECVGDAWLGLALGLG